MSLSSKLITKLLTRKLTAGLFECNSCGMSIKSANGYTNVINHMRRYHPTYETQAQAVTTDPALVRVNRNCRAHEYLRHATRRNGFRQCTPNAPPRYHALCCEVSSIERSSAESGDDSVVLEKLGDSVACWRRRSRLSIFLI